VEVTLYTEHALQNGPCVRPVPAHQER
jgi:hypothetical protein